MILIRALLADEEEAIGVVNNVEVIDAKPHASWKDQVAGMTPLLCIFLVFYWFILRPQSKKLKERTKMINELKVGDKVKTNGGMIVTIKKIEDDLLTEIASGVEARFAKDAIVSKI